MNLYARDFSIPINKEEIEAIEQYNAWINNHERKFRNTADDPRHSHPDIKMRELLWHYTSLFPNNHLLFPSFAGLDYSQEAELFSEVIYSGKNEQEVQQYIKSNRKWFIPGSILLDYNFGHHDAYLYPEQTLGGKYNVDYLLIGFNSDGCNLVLVEFEKPDTGFIISTAHTEAESVRKGLTQIRDWRTWMDDHRVNFLKDIGISSKGFDVPSSRIYYYLVVSRRDKMNDAAKILRSQLVNDDAHLKIVTFDRLITNVKNLSQRHSY